MNKCQNIDSSFARLGLDNLDSGEICLLYAQLLASSNLNSSRLIKVKI